MNLALFPISERRTLKVVVIRAYGGRAAIEAARLERPDLIIALTALAMKGDEERIRAAGCDGYVAKPLAYQDFLAVVSASVAPPSPPRA